MKNLADRLRFESKYVKDEKTECWEWIAGKFDSGYGAFQDEGKLVGAHRASYALYTTHIPEDLCVLHRCDNRSCVNPSHLFLGTRKDNHDDMVSKGRASWQKNT